MTTLINDSRTPWGGFSQKLELGAVTAEEMAKAAGLDWEIQKVQLAYDWTDPKGKTHKKRSKQYALTRADTGRELGNAKKNYEVVQNAEAFALFDVLTESGKLIYDTAGTLKGGSIVWAQAQLPGWMVVSGDDVISKTILISLGHTGGMSTRIGLTPISVLCLNTLTLAHQLMDRSDQVLARIRHTKDAHNQLEELSKLLAECEKVYREFEELARRLAYTEVDEGIAMAYARLMGEWMIPDRGRSEESRNKAIAKIQRAILYQFEEGPGAKVKSRLGTAWGLYNAATAWSDHVRGRDDEARVYHSWFGGGVAFKQNALVQALELL